MKQHCYNPKAPKYRIYGAKGISLCDDWKQNFKSFYDWALLNRWKKGLTLDRIDSSKGYYPLNCQFITLSESNKKVHAARRIKRENFSKVFIQ